MKQINAQDRLPRRRDLTARIAGTETLVRDSVSSQVHFLSGTASAIWRLCDGKTTVSECEQHLRASFAIPDDADVAADIHEALRNFAQKGLLEETPDDV